MMLNELIVLGECSGSFSSMRFFLKVVVDKVCFIVFLVNKDDL